jgi:hypothetical protein
MKKAYDNSWDIDPDDPNYSERCEEAFEEKLEEWEERDWMDWLAENLSFPFKVVREEDLDEWDEDHEETEEKEDGPFQVGHTMEVLGFDEDGDDDFITLQVKEDDQIGSVPLCDVEVTPKTDKNYWPVREYVVWFSNQ